MAATSPTIDIESDVFARRLANLLRATRLDKGRSLRALAKSSDGRFTSVQLRQFEEGGTGLDEDLVQALSALYGADLGTILPSRLPVAIAGGVISAGGVTATFVATNSTSLLTAYLRLIRSMRRQKKAPMIVLRREDIVVIAEYLDEPGETIIDRLTALMGATLTQRTAMATMFATGAIVIGLAGSTAARAPETAGTSGTKPAAPVAEVVAADEVVAAAPDTTVVGADEAMPVPVPAVGFEEAAQQSDHAIDRSPVAEAVTETTLAAASPTASPTTVAVAVADATAAVAAPTTDPVAVADAAAAEPDVTPPTVVDTGDVVIPDLPYGDAVVLEDPASSTTTADAATDAPPSVPPVVATGSPSTPGSDEAPVTSGPVVPVVGEIPVVVEIPAVEIPEVASEAPVPVRTLSLVGQAPLAEMSVVAPSAQPPVARVADAKAGAAERTTEVKRTKRDTTKRDKRAAALVAAKVARIDSKAVAAIERATNRIYIEADEERVAALKVIYARAEAAITRASGLIYANGGGANAHTTMAGVKEEIYARADADKDALLDRIYSRADADRAAAVQVIEERAAAARAASGQP